MVNVKNLSRITYLIVISLVVISIQITLFAEYQNQGHLTESDWTKIGIIISFSLAVGLTICFLTRDSKSDAGDNPEMKSKETDKGFSVVVDRFSRSNLDNIELPDVTIGAGINGNCLDVGVISSF